MELQVAGRGGSKRKYALADIKADIANKRLFVRTKAPPHWGELPSPPLPQGAREGITPLTPTLALTPMGSTTRQRQRQQQHQQHQQQQHRLPLPLPLPLPPRHSLGVGRGGSSPSPRPQRPETGDRETKPDYILYALLGRFAGPGPLLVLCCIRLILNDFSTATPQGDAPAPARACFLV
jgi:hypothetical protein